MPMSEPDTIEREIRIAARPETIFPFLVDPAQMMRWTGGLISLDARPGGIYRVAAAENWVQRGEFVEVVPPEKVVFTFGLEGADSPIPPGGSRVEIRLIPDGDGTLVRLRHTGLPTGQGDQFGGGWQRYLDRLAIAAVGDDPGVDEWCEQNPVEETVHIAASPAAVITYLVDAERMTDWMGVKAQLEPHYVGAVRVKVNDQNQAQGEFLEVVPGERVAHTWGWRGTDGSSLAATSTVAWTLTPEDGGTQVRLAHFGLSETARAGHAEGWAHYLPRLRARAEGQDPGPDEWATPAPDAAG
jgi:uncharacterized protein YndB with AHSA1/START domain